MRDRHAPHRSLMGVSENLPRDLLRWLASSCRGCRQNKRSFVLWEINAKEKAKI